MKKGIKKTAIIIASSLILSGISVAAVVYWLQERKIQEKNGEIEALQLQKDELNRDLSAKDAQIQTWSEEMAEYVSDGSEPVEEPAVDTVTSSSEGCPVLPQIAVNGKAYFSSTELNQLETNLFNPFVAYYENTGYTVVSINVETDGDVTFDRSRLLVTGIISNNDGDNEPIIHGFVYEKAGGSYPVWEPDEM